jgi:hypothetical protein
MCHWQKQRILFGFGRNDTFGCTITAKIITHCALQLPLKLAAGSLGSAVQGFALLHVQTRLHRVTYIPRSGSGAGEWRAVLICIFPVGVRDVAPQQPWHITAYFLPTMSRGCTCFSSSSEHCRLKRSGFQTFYYFNETFTTANNDLIIL